jgi:hypothetical protein
MNDQLFTPPVFQPVINRCKDCNHHQGLCYGSKIIYYCKTRSSNRTNNKMLKIKLKNPACKWFIQKVEK